MDKQQFMGLVMLVLMVTVIFAGFPISFTILFSGAGLRLSGLGG